MRGNGDSTMIKLTNTDVLVLAARVAERITAMEPCKIVLYGVPRGGIPAAYALHSALMSKNIEASITDAPNQATHIVDDLIDSGATLKAYREDYPTKLFVALIDKRTEQRYHRQWITFPWEQGPEEHGIEDNVRRVIQFLGDDPKREGLLDTPARVARAWSHWGAGYGKNPADVLRVFEDGAENVDELVVVKDIPFYSQCEHHMAPFFGTATIGYIPNGKIVGLSKLSRLLDIFARRLQVQERLTNQVADALIEHLDPLGVGVIINARHLCMESRGICKQGHLTITSAVRGALREKPEARAEFMALARA